MIFFNPEQTLIDVEDLPKTMEQWNKIAENPIDFLTKHLRDDSPLMEYIASDACPEGLTQAQKFALMIVAMEVKSIKETFELIQMYNKERLAHLTHHVSKEEIEILKATVLCDDEDHTTH